MSQAAPETQLAQQTEQTQQMRNKTTPLPLSSAFTLSQAGEQNDSHGISRALTEATSDD